MGILDIVSKLLLCLMDDCGNDDFLLIYYSY